MTDNPYHHAYYHRSSVETIKVRFSCDEMAPPSLSKLNHTINRTNDNRSIRYNYCRNIELEFASFWKWCGDTLCPAILRSTIPQYESCRRKYQVSDTLNNNSYFLIFKPITVMVYHEMRCRNGRSSVCLSFSR